MPSKVRLNFLKNCPIYVSKGVIWSSEYSLGPQIWGPGGSGPPGPPGSATGYKYPVRGLRHTQSNKECQVHIIT